MFRPVYRLGDSEGMRDGAAARAREDGQQTHPVRQRGTGQMVTALMADHFLFGGPYGMWDLSSLIRDQTQWNMVLITGP